MSVAAIKVGIFIFIFAGVCVACYFAYKEFQKFKNLGKHAGKAAKAAAKAIKNSKTGKFFQGESPCPCDYPVQLGGLCYKECNHQEGHTYTQYKMLDGKPGLSCLYNCKAKYGSDYYNNGTACVRDADRKKKKHSLLNLSLES